MQVTADENNAYGEFVQDLANELGVFNRTGVDTLWHYTDGNGFLGILQSGRLFATQVSALNDSKETEYATDLFKDAVNNSIKDKSDDPQAVAFFSKVLDLIKEEPGTTTQGISKFYVTCFSSMSDDVNQWAKYTKTSPGRFAIGFHPSGLDREQNSTLYRVI